ncbi:MAG: rhodanese-like domain-containing protein [Acidimicrobiaceae bacterium]|nr:rhodanese-like domain-containing protein [Acidimicrobiaceae bacterium]MDE0497148.1 rhodanese-like domain-containing protein [Acidimicrobiaceae bacterium]
MPAPQRTTVHQLLEAARSGLERVGPAELADLMNAEGSDETPRLRVIDIRPRDDRERTGVIEGSEHIGQLVLEWRLDPDSGASEGTAADLDDHLVILCNQGYSSSFAAAQLQRLGFARATDLDGGIEGWVSHGLPVVPPPEASGRSAD